MALTTTSYVERVLIVLNADGTMKGAHQEGLCEVKDGATLVSASMLPAAPLDAQTLAGILPTQASLAAQVQTLTDQLAAANAAKSEAEAARDQALADKAAALADKATAQARVAELEAQAHPVDGNGFPILSSVQIRLGLLGAGITTATIQSLIEAIPDPVQRETAHTYWDYSTQYHRDHPLVQQFAAALSLTTEQVDAMWHAAAQIG